MLHAGVGADHLHHGHAPMHLGADGVRHLLPLVGDDGDALAGAGAVEDLVDHDGAGAGHDDALQDRVHPAEDEPARQDDGPVDEQGDRAHGQVRELLADGHDEEVGAAGAVAAHIDEGQTRAGDKSGEQGG